MSAIRILLADDHIVMRRGLRLLLESQPEFTVVAEASDGREAGQGADETCAKYSHATTVRIRIEQLILRDDGQGFDAGQTKGLGLLGIQERVEQFAGSCRVHSEPGRGTILSVELPVVKEYQSQ